MIDHLSNLKSSRPFWESRTGLLTLLLIAVILTAASFVFQALQGPSLIWHVDGEDAIVTVVRFPSEAATRTYKWGSIADIDSVEMPENPGIHAIVYMYSGLNLRSPWQNSRDISRYNDYFPALKEFFRQARLDNVDAKLQHYHRCYPLAMASMLAAIGVWILFFGISMMPRK